ncbi:MAG: hypothetical protein PHT49_07695 [Desulfovibrionales bacterium]|nr:hypothetical protein [Desulfovibrionales bacterium]
MRGTIYAINNRRGTVAVQTENGDFSVFELLASDNVDVGDEVYWKDDTSLGSTILTNMTKAQKIEVYFQNHWVPKQQLKWKPMGRNRWGRCFLRCITPIRLLSKRLYNTNEAYSFYTLFQIKRKAM